MAHFSAEHFGIDAKCVVVEDGLRFVLIDASSGHDGEFVRIQIESTLQAFIKRAHIVVWRIIER